jgi:nucleoside-diphosphate-sugar epimerase
LARQLVAGVSAQMSSGLVKRDYIDVRDCGAALCALSRSDASGDFDIANGQGLRLRELAAILATAAGRPELLSVNPALDRPEEPAQIVGDPSALRLATRFEPAYSIEQSITDILDYWRNRRCP